MARSCGPYGCGISSCLQMARTVPSLISRCKTQPWWRRWRSNSASFMLQRFREPHARRMGKGLFPQARAGTAPPVLARPQDSLWPLRWSRPAKSRQETLPQSKYSPLFGGLKNGCQFHASRLSHPAMDGWVSPFSNFPFPVSIFYIYFKCFSNNLPANPANPSCHACVIMPGRRLFRVSARIPKSSP